MEKTKDAVEEKVAPPPPYPRYQSHKQVSAVKIEAVRSGEALATTELVFAAPYIAIHVSQDWVQKHRPTAGGYFVVYDGGYTSFSPADVFEGGYTLLAAKAIEKSKA